MALCRLAFDGKAGGEGGGRREVVDGGRGRPPRPRWHSRINHAM